MVLASSVLMKSKDSKSITCSKFHPLPSKSGEKKKKKKTAFHFYFRFIGMFKEMSLFC